jgi:hypothetical protein
MAEITQPAWLIVAEVVVTGALCALLGFCAGLVVQRFR